MGLSKKAGPWSLRACVCACGGLAAIFVLAMVLAVIFARPASAAQLPPLPGAPSSPSPASPAPVSAGPVSAGPSTPVAAAPVTASPTGASPVPAAPQAVGDAV